MRTANCTVSLQKLSGAFWVHFLPKSPSARLKTASYRNCGLSMVDYFTAGKRSISLLITCLEHVTHSAVIASVACCFCVGATDGLIMAVGEILRHRWIPYCFPVFNTITLVSNAPPCGSRQKTVILRHCFTTLRPSLKRALRVVHER